MTQDPTQDVATHLASAGLSLTVGTNLFMGPVRAAGDGIPQAAVFVHGQGGDAPEPYQGASGSTWEVEVEVTIRSEPKDFTGGRTRARAILQAIHLASLSGYYSVRSEDAEPDYLEQDDAGCHEWAVAFTLAWVA